MRRLPLRPLFSLLRRYPLLWLPLLLLLGVGYGYEVWVARPAMAYLGLPETAGFDPERWTHVLRNRGFLVGYSELRGNPLWVQYKVSPIAADAPLPPRPQRFERDLRNLTGIQHQDYAGSGFDRGHMAPNYLIAKLHGREGQLETFLMTNITPQRPSLNQKLWQRLEEIEAERFGGRFPALWVVTGPVFDDERERLKGGWVEVPDAFYKIYAAPGDPPRLLAFLMPQKVKGNEPLADYLVSVDRIEALTGFNFFPELPERVAQALEAAVDPEPWGIRELGRRPGRY